MARSTSGRGLRRLGSDPGEECIYTAECVAAAATVYLAMLNVGLTAPTAAARSLWLPSLNEKTASRMQFVREGQLCSCFSIVREAVCEKSGWYQSSTVWLCQVGARAPLTRRPFRSPSGPNFVETWVSPERTAPLTRELGVAMGSSSVRGRRSSSSRLYPPSPWQAVRSGIAGDLAVGLQVMQFQIRLGTLAPLAKEKFSSTVGRFLMLAQVSA